MQIASVLEKEFRFLHDTLTSLEETAGHAAHPAFANLSHQLDSWAARVAIIGQAKAGKSSVLNALLDHVELLPTDVNPSTSAITNIRLNIGSDPDAGARFEFFDKECWGEITGGNSEGRLTVEFAPDEPLQQAEEMKLRLKHRIGQRYEELLGTSHEYEAQTPQVIQQYICAESYAETDDADPNQGRFTALTQEANLFLRSPDLGLPIVLTETPAVSDPPQVREALNCKTLDEADLYVMILSAHQPLSTSETDEIKVLAMRPGKEVIVFINRIDELDEYDTEHSEVVEEMRDRLHASIPNHNLNIQVGSAYFAQLALRTDDEAREIRDILDDEHLTKFLLKLHGHVPETQIGRFAAASGISGLKRALSDALNQGVGSRKLRTIRESLRSELNAAVATTSSEQRSMQTQIDNVSQSQNARAKDAITEELEALKELLEKLKLLFENAAFAIDKTLTKTSADLKQAMEVSIRAFIEYQHDTIKKQLLQTPRLPSAINQLEISLAPIRRQWETDIARQYDKFRTATDAHLSNCHRSCAYLAGEHFDDLGAGISLEDLPYEDFATTHIHSVKTLLIDMIASKGWNFWKASEVDVEESLEALGKLANAELASQMNRITAAFSDAQKDRTSAGKERLQIMIRMIENAVEERTRRLQADRLELSSSNPDPKASKRMLHRLQTQKEMLEHRLRALSDIECSFSQSAVANAA